MLRLTGLPAVETHPYALVDRTRERILIVFAGERGVRQISVDPALVGEDEDPEEVELQLLARLQQIGYQVEWRRSAGDGHADSGPRQEPRRG